MSDKMYRVYTVVPRENEKPFWLNIGIAHKHKDGKEGFTLNLQALPLDGKLVIREVDEQPREEQKAETEKV